MPRYYFDVDDGERFIRDDEGTDCRDVMAARAEAIAVLPDVVRWVLPDGDRRTIVSWVRDAAGRNVLAATLALSTEWLPAVRLAPPQAL